MDVVVKAFFGTQTFLSKLCVFLECMVPIPSMGLVHFPTWMVDFHGINVGKYRIVPWMLQEGARNPSYKVVK